MIADTDESILGLLLRAHARVSEQAHGEQYVHRNISASQSYENARSSIESAIRQVTIAERYVARQEVRMEQATASRLQSEREDEGGK